jgi:anthranilate synthase component I
MSAPQFHVEPIALTPGALLALASGQPDKYPALLDSAAQGALSHHSMLAALPRGTITLDADGGIQGAGPMTRENFLPVLERAWRDAARDAPGRPAQLPFAGGWIIYLGYELAREIEPTLQSWWPAASLVDARPVACAMRVPAVLIQDEAGKGLLVCEPDVTAAERASILDDLRRVTAGSRAMQPTPALPLVEEAAEAYIQRILAAQEYIRAGDIYQANLSRRPAMHWPTCIEGCVPPILHPSRPCASSVTFASCPRHPSDCCRSAAGGWTRVPLPAPIPVARRMRTIARWPRRSSPIPRNARNT